MHLLWRRHARARPPRVVVKRLDTIIAFYGSLKGFAPQTSTNAPFLNAGHNRAAASRCHTPVPVLEVGPALRRCMYTRIEECSTKVLRRLFDRVVVGVMSDEKGQKSSSTIFRPSSEQQSFS